MLSQCSPSPVVLTNKSKKQSLSRWFTTRSTKVPSLVSSKGDPTPSRLNVVCSRRIRAVRLAQAFARPDCVDQRILHDDTFVGGTVLDAIFKTTSHKLIFRPAFSSVVNLIECSTTKTSTSTMYHCQLSTNIFRFSLPQHWRAIAKLEDGRSGIRSTFSSPYSLQLKLLLAYGNTQS